VLYKFYSKLKLDWKFYALRLVIDIYNYWLIILKRKSFLLNVHILVLQKNDEILNYFY